MRHYNLLPTTHQNIAAGKQEVGFASPSRHPDSDLIKPSPQNLLATPELNPSLSVTSRIPTPRIPRQDAFEESSRRNLTLIR